MFLIDSFTFFLHSLYINPNVSLGFFCFVAFVQVGGSDLAKQQEQLGTSSIPVTSVFDFCFAENGLTAYRLGKPMASSSFIQWLGEDKYQTLVNFCLRYIADVKLPRKRGTFVEFRNGMVNISPVGRNANVEERNEFEKYDVPDFLGRMLHTHSREDLTRNTTFGKHLSRR